MRKEICQAAWLGNLPYETAWRMQEELAEEVAFGKRPASFLLLEHPHTFTAGRSTKPGHLLWNEAERKKNGVELFEVDRGGDITYHGPGQLVGYPLFKLPPLRLEENDRNSTDAVGFIRKIESALILALVQFGIVGCQNPGFSGVWVEQKPENEKLLARPAKKIASIGVKVDVNRVTRHGFALNVDPDMRYWSGIIACGLEGVAMTSMVNCLGWVPKMERVIEAVIHSFETIFGYEIIFKHPKKKEGDLPMETTRKVLNIAHRGARSLAPENTIAAARKAFELGADMWEMDVAMSADGELVVIHDDTLARTSNASVLFGTRKPLKVQNFTLKELRLLDFGSWFNNTDPFKQIRTGNVTLEEMHSYVGLNIPTLEEALVFTREKEWRINVEIKDLKGTKGDEVVVAMVVKMITDLDMANQVIISSFQHHYINQVKDINPDIQTGALIEWLDLEPLKTLAKTRANAYHPGTRLINAKTIRQIREKGYDINVWTVNKEPSMRKLIKAGATGIITDFPQVFNKVISLMDRS